MRYVMALWLTIVWMKAWMGLSLHYLKIWEPQFRPRMSSEEMNALLERIKTGPLGYEYTRVEQMKNKAIAAWSGDIASEKELR